MMAPPHTAVEPGIEEAGTPPASGHLDAHGDGGAGNDGGILVVGVRNVEAALDGLYRDVADGLGLLDLVEVYTLRPLHPDRDLDIELGLVDLQRAHEGQRTVMQRILH